MKVSLENLKEYLEVSDNSPSGLLWKKDNVGINGRKYNLIGTTAGVIKPYHILKASCWVIVIGGIRYYAHRIIFNVLGQNLECGDVVDHVDGNPLNNKVNNLQVTNQSTNMRNAKLRKDTSTGITGVSYTCRKNKHPVYIATWYDIDGKQRTKEFSTYRLSDATALKLASDHRKQMITELNLQGAGVLVCWSNK